MTVPIEMKWTSVRPALRRLSRRRAFRSTVAALLVYALVGFLLLPYLAEWYFPQYARERLQRQGEIADVRLNPFLFILEVDGFRLREADGQPLVAARHLAVDFELSSLLRWAWTFADLRADGLDLNLVTRADGRFNLGALADSFRSEVKTPSAENGAARMLLRHIAVTDGAVKYRDLALDANASTTVTPVNFELENVTTLPEREGHYAFNAEFPGGGSLYLQGSTRIKPFETTGILSIQGLRPATFWTFLQERLRLAEPQGEWVLQAGYRFASEPAGLQLTLKNIMAYGAGFDLREPAAKTPLLALDAVELKGGEFDLARRVATFPDIVLRSGQASAQVAEDGRVNWQTLSPARKITAAVAKPTRPGGAKSAARAPWKIRFGALKLDDVALQVVDHSRTAALQLDAGQFAARLAFDVNVGTATSLAATIDSVDLRQVTLKRLDTDEAVASVGRVRLAAGKVDTGAKSVAIERLELRGGGTRLERDAQGKLRGSELLTLKAGQAGAAPPPAAARSGWRFGLNSVQAEALRVTVVDRSVQPVVQYDLEDIKATVNEISNDAHKPAAFDATLRVAQGGNLTARGRFALDGSYSAVDMNIERVALGPLHSLLARYAALDLKHGDASAALSLDYKKAAEAPVLKISGSARIDDLRLDEEITGDRFLAWQTLRADAIDFESAGAPARLTIKEARLKAPRAKIEIFDDRSVNLGRVFEKKSAAERKALRETETRTPSTDNEAKSKPVQVEVARVRVEDGTVFYADHSLVLPFSAQIREFRGTASGVSSQRDSRTRLQFEGRVEDYGSAKVSGALSPFEPKTFTDVRTEFRNIDMPPFSPYSATFAGRKIADGKLSLDLQYKIVDGALAGDNKIFMEKFTLGERVESPDALDLPLDLAVALLTDSRGRIDIAIPVRGNMNKPQFSLGGVIGEAVTRMLTRIVTAPFSALGKLLNGGDPTANRIAFEPGSARLTPPQQEKLIQVGKALRDRPQLKLGVDGRYDPQVDGSALRAERVRRDLAAELGIELTTDESPGPVAFEQAATQRALEALLETQSGDQAVDTFQSRYEKQTGKPAERVNPVLGRLGQASADHAFYEALFEHLVEVYPMAEADLQALARARATAVEHALVGNGGIADARVDVGAVGTAQGNRDRMVETLLRLEVYRSSK